MVVVVVVVVGGGVVLLFPAPVPYCFNSNIIFQMRFYTSQSFSVLMCANHLNAGQRNANVNGIKLSGLKKLSSTKSRKGHTILHFMIDRLFTKDPGLLDLGEDFPSLKQVCVLSSIVMKNDRTELENGLAKLTKTMEEAAMNGDDLFMEKFTDFKDRADVLTEALCDKFDSAMHSYDDACEYLAEDPKNMKHEDFFKLLKGFLDTFKATKKKADDTRKRNEAKQKKEAQKKKKEEAKKLRAAKKTKSPRAVKTKQTLEKESKSKTQLLMERRRRLSMTPSIITKTSTRKVLTGTPTHGVDLGAIDENSSEESEDSSSSDTGSSSSSDDDE